MPAAMLIGAVAILYMMAMGLYIIGVGIAMLLFGFKPKWSDL